MSQISTVLIPAWVVQLNNEQFINQGESSVVPRLMEVPCRNALIDDVNYWAIPIKDSGIFTVLEMKPVLGNDGVAVPAPTFDSFIVCRVRDKLTNYRWWVLGTKDDFITSCSTCCDSPAISMPDGSEPIVIAPCQSLCPNSDGDIVGTFGLPGLGAGESYFPTGALNNVAYSDATPGGYTTVADLLTFLNANYLPFVWTASGDELTLLATGGAEDDELCVIVKAIS